MKTFLRLSLIVICALLALPTDSAFAQAPPLLIGTLNTTRTVVAPLSGDWNLSVGQTYSTARQLLTDPVNFGTTGTVQRTVQFVQTERITPDFLRSVHIFFLNRTRNMTLEEMALLIEYVREGGALMMTQEQSDRRYLDIVPDPSHNPATTRSVATTQPVPVNGPFGAVAQLTVGNNVNYTLPSGALLLAAGATGALSMMISPASGSSWAGRLLVVGDEEIFMNGTYSGEVTGRVSTPANQRFFLNSIAWLAGAPGLTLTSLTDGPYFRPGWYYNSQTGHTYRLIDVNPLDLLHAEAVARGGNLATINDAAENQWIVDTFKDHITQILDVNGFIGLSRTTAGGSFSWLSGENAAYRNFLAGEPQNDELGTVIALKHRTVTPGKWLGTSPSGYVGIVEFPAHYPVILLEPTGEFDVHVGDPIFVHWKTDLNTAGTGVRFELWDDGVFIDILARGWAPDGDGDGWFKLPSVPAGKGYRLHAVSEWDSSYRDIGSNRINVLNPENNAAQDWTFYR